MARFANAWRSQESAPQALLQGLVLNFWSILFNVIMLLYNGSVTCCSGACEAVAIEIGVR